MKEDEWDTGDLEESLQHPSELEVKRSTQNCPRIQLLRCKEHGRVLFLPSNIASSGSGEMKEDLMGVEIPENPNYGHDEADTYNFRIASFGSGEMQGDLKGAEIPEITDYGHDEADSYDFRIASFEYGEMQEDLKEVEIPENIDYGYDEAAKYEYASDEADKYNHDYPRTKRMSIKITEDECSRAMGAECNDKIVALTRARRGMTHLV